MRSKTSTVAVLAVGLSVVCTAMCLAAGAPVVTAKMSAAGIEVKIDGKLFTTYRYNFLGTPVFYPVIGPGGENLTRHFPMKEGVAGEDLDHMHHRSIWFGHRDVNGQSFWGARDEDGVVKHLGVKRLEESEGEVLIVTDNELVATDGEVLGSEEREYRIRALGGGEARLDYAVRIVADRGVDLKFGDNKDGIMGVRVARWMKLEDRKGNLAGGSMVNSEGVTGKVAWGKRADWVDYYGTAPDGEVYGIAMFDHPENLRHPTWWHARSYGLLSANPFAQGDFEKGKVPEDAGAYTVKKGEELTLRYGFFFHRGDAGSAKVAERYAEFAGGK